MSYGMRGTGCGTISRKRTCRFGSVAVLRDSLRFFAAGNLLS